MPAPGFRRVSGCQAGKFLARLGEDLGLDEREQSARGTDFRLLTEYLRLERGSVADLHAWMCRDWRVGDDGDLDDVETLVVAETDYFRRLAFQDPLDIKLSADAFGATLLFVGYSVSDVNLRLLLYRLRGLWQRSGQEDIRPCSYVFMGRANRLQQRILDSWGVAAFVADDGEDEGRSLQAFLERLRHAVADIRGRHLIRRHLEIRRERASKAS